MKMIQWTFAACLVACGTADTPVTAANNPLVGIWEGTRDAGPEIQGELILSRHGDQWLADVAGFKLPVIQEGQRLSFEIPGERGRFSGQIESDQNPGHIYGHWVQPGTINNGMPHASPVRLGQSDDGSYRGSIVPLPDTFTVMLKVDQRADGSTGAFMRNPDRGFGVFLNIDHLELHGDRVDLIGKWFRNQNTRTLSTAQYDREANRMLLNVRGYLYELQRTSNEASSHFYARGREPGPYHYIPPPQRDDGWAVGTLDEVNIDVEPITRLIEEIIYPPAQSIDDIYVHGFLMARHGKLVLEEYFHGFDRDTPHDTRSASKSMAAILAGAAIEKGFDIALDTPVYQTILGSELVAKRYPDLDPRARAITLRDLVSMSSGLDCDDGDGDSPANEDTVQSQEEQPDWYRYMLDLKMLREPGEKAVYCSMGINLTGAVLASATDQPLEQLVDSLIARPLDIKRYHLNLDPLGRPYMGGGIYWLPRDFMKLGQLVVNGGTWNGRRIISEQWASQSRTKLYDIRDKGYNYAWWTLEYPYQDRTVTAFFAGGNGGQIVMGIPELDLVLAFFAGNYSHRTMFRIQEEFAGLLLAGVR